MLRLILSIVAGTVIAFAIVAAGEVLLQAIRPSSAFPTDPDAMTTFVERQPPALLVGVVAGWTLGAFAGSAIAARFGRRGAWPGWIVGGLFLLATASNFVMIPHPMWMIAAGTLLVLAAIWLGATMGAGGRAV